MADALDLDCGIATSRITSWLDDELGLPCSDCCWTFSEHHRTCLVQVEPLESRTFGTISLERTRLIAHGDSEAVESFNRLFTLRFISAGG